MSKLNLTLKATVPTFGAASTYLKKSGDAVIVDRNGPRWLILKCPCGCGEEFPINLDSRTGPAWKLYKNRRTGLSLYPSVWRKSECKSHYVIWRNQIFLFNRYEEGFYINSQFEAINKIQQIKLWLLDKFIVLANAYWVGLQNIRKYTKF